jgi:hypothetical protein
MNSADLVKAIEVAEESVAGFADNDSFEMLLAHAVLELQKRLNAEREAYNNLRGEIKLIRGDLL